MKTTQYETDEKPSRLLHSPANRTKEIVIHQAGESSINVKPKTSSENLKLLNHQIYCEPSSISMLLFDSLSLQLLQKLLDACLTIDIEDLACAESIETCRRANRVCSHILKIEPVADFQNDRELV